MTPHTHFRHRLLGGEQLLGYWCVLDAPVAAERVAMVGFDYVAIDMQHGLIGYAGMVGVLTAIDAGGSVGMVRVGENSVADIGRALDCGAVGVIVPLIDDADDAARAVAAARYSSGRRSYGPMRSGLRVGPTPVDADAAVVVLVMIETANGLENVEEICRVPGVDGVYVGPSDLRLALGGASSTDPAVDEAFERALERIGRAADETNVAAGIHTPTGAVAQQRLAQGFTFASIASDLTHLEIAARDHLARARTPGGESDGT